MLIQNKSTEGCKFSLPGKKLAKAAFLLLFALQFGLLVYFNLATIEKHMGYDSSWSFLKTALIRKEQTFVSDKWQDTTNSLLDSSVPLASLLYGLTGNLYVSYGLVNLLILTATLWCMNSLLCLLGIDSANTRLLCLNLMLCPFLADNYTCLNNLGYFSSMLCGGAFYNVKAFLVLLIVREYLVLGKTRKVDGWGIASLFLCAIAGASTGMFILIIIILPYLLFLLEKVYLKNSFRPLLQPDALYAYAATGSVLLGKLLASHVLGLSANDIDKTWTSVESLFKNLGAPVQGLFKLLNALPLFDSDTAILSRIGIVRVFPLFILAVIVLSIVAAIRCLKKEMFAEKGNILFLVNIIAVNYLVFSFFNVQYGLAFFEERYLICTFMILIILTGWFLQRDSAFVKLLKIGLFLCIAANDCLSDKIFMDITNEQWQMAEIKAIADAQDAEVIYVWGEENTRVLGRCLRVYDLDHIYKNVAVEGYYYHAWGDYLYYEDITDYSGSTLLILPNEKDLETEPEDYVPDHIMEKYSLIARLNKVSIYQCPGNPMDRAAGITGDISVDYPSTPEIRTQLGEFDGDSFISDGTIAAHILYGPFTETPNGTYDFTLDYSILTGEKAKFDVALDNGTAILGTIALNPKESSVTLSNIALEKGHQLEYRVFADKGTRVKIDQITIVKTGE